MKDEYFYFEVEAAIIDRGAFMRIKRQITKEEFDKHKTEPNYFMGAKKDWQFIPRTAV